jgi:uncharacterized protein YfdQ (DUF2303 family)
MPDQSLGSLKTIGDQIERLSTLLEQSKSALDLAAKTAVLNGMQVTFEGGAIVRREDLEIRPPFRVENVELASVDSYIAYVNRAKRSTLKSVTFSDESNGFFCTVFDYEDDSGILRGDHQAKLTLEHTRSFNAWHGAMNKKMSQEDFALFLEENASDIVEPAAAQMIAVAQQLRATTEASFESKVNLNNGSVTFNYAEETKGSTQNGQAEVPSSFFIGVTVYRGMTEAYKIECKLRYRIANGKLVLWFSIPQLGKALEDAFAGIKKQIGDGVGPDIPIYDV